MPKVFGLHEIELRPDVDPAEYERYFAEQAAMQPTLQGWTAKLLRADRGPRAGKFLVLYEIESVEAAIGTFPMRDSLRRSSPASSTSTPRSQRPGRSRPPWRRPTSRRTTSCG
jgi:hypothetical protein